MPASGRALHFSSARRSRAVSTRSRSSNGVGTGMKTPANCIGRFYVGGRWNANPPLERELKERVPEERVPKERVPKEREALAERSPCSTRFNPKTTRNIAAAGLSSHGKS